MDKNKPKLRPPRIYKNKKGYYYKVNGKKRYIKLDKNISEKQLVNINIKNVVGYLPRKKRKPRIKKGAKGQQPVKVDISSESKPVPPSFKDSISNLMFSQRFLPQLQYYPSQRLQDINNQPKSDNTTTDMSKLIAGLIELPKTFAPLLLKNKPEITKENISNIIRGDEALISDIYNATVETARTTAQQELEKYAESQKNLLKEFPVVSSSDEESTSTLDSETPPPLEPVPPPVEDKPKVPSPKKGVPTKPVEESVPAPTTDEPKTITEQFKRRSGYKGDIDAIFGTEFTDKLLARAGKNTNALADWNIFTFESLVNSIDSLFKKNKDILIENESKDGDYEKFVVQINDFKNAINKTEARKRKSWSAMLFLLKKAGIKGSGKYSDDDDGLYTSEISDILEKHIPEEYIPVIANDQILTLLPLVNKNTQRFGFIINTDNAGGVGKHWRAVFISRPDASVEYYDSLVSEPDKKFVSDVKKLLDKMDDNVYYKFKVNQVKDQSDDSNNCGYFAMKFLMDRFDDKKFKKASHYDRVDLSKLGEKQIKKFKNYL